MNADSGDGPDHFSRVLPLPYRLQLQLILGFWLWGLNLHGFYLRDIDIFALIRYPTRPTDDEPPLHLSTYRLASLLSGLWVASIVFFWNITHGDAELVVAYDWVPNLTLFLILVLLVLPRINLIQPLFGSGNAHGLARLWTGLQRVAFGGIAAPKAEKFGDVLLADAMTSYAKPISEIFVATCMFVANKHTTDRPERLCGHELVVPLALTWPFVIRLRQCLKERQWLNALKYSTMFPVIALSAMARNNPSLIVAKNLAAVVNSSYSLWWDVTMDWDLTLLTQMPRKSPYGLRPKLVFMTPLLYYTVILIDVVLRFSWSMKLSLHLFYLDDIEGSIFLLEILELLRRWMWVFFRVETEWVRAGVIPGVDL